MATMTARPTTPRNPAPIERPDAVRNQCRLMVAVFVFVVAVVWAGAPGALRYLYPALALAMAVLLFVRSRANYVSFVFWLYFLSPFLRRLVDWRLGFEDVSPLLLAPGLATLVSVYVLATRGRTLARPGALTFSCALAGIFFGTIVGLTRYSPVDVGRAFFNWVPPITFAFMLYEERERFAVYRKAIETALLWGTIVMGVYGALQFFVLPPWDRSWMIGVAFNVFGEPEPMRMRVFSTMNAPATFATYTMAGLLMLFSLQSRLRIPAAALGFVALVLTTSRASWLGLLPGLIFLAFQMPLKVRMRIFAGMIACVLLAGASMLIPAVNEIVSSRLRTISSPTSDVSYRARIVGHEDGFARLSGEPFGEGLGSMDVDHATDGRDDRLGPHDSTVLELLYSLGLPGTAMYLLGLALGVARVVRVGLRTPFAVAMAAIFISYCSEVLLNSIFLGVLGFMVWTAVGMSLAEAERQTPGLGV
ncbi:O-Antigen ligase [Granulicella rosea]|uniref:O-Antigen ligase n=1 Tax=Granulicella rosea TaxID=474952 RepID=A0A239L0E8_9BACT|nr:O-antigen ligase family protein [Granulicella rosea]SNT23931.1 O-Antigen ligase [Granulicella rosea]